MATPQYVRYEYMRRMVEDVMLYTATRLAYVVDHDVFGGEDVQYVPSEVFPCGIRSIRVSEQPSYTGVAAHYDARVRLPYDAYDILNVRDRLRITIGTDTEDYEIVGFISKSAFTTNLEVKRVQS